MSSSAIGISKRDILTFLFKWKAGIFGWAFFTVMAVTILSYVLPQQYVATAKIVMKSTKAPGLRTSYVAGLESIEVMNNEIEIIRSRTVMSKVVDELGPHLRPRRTSRFNEIVNEIKEWMAGAGLVTNLEPRSAWIEGLLRSVKAESVVNSNVVEISYADENPEWAAKVVNSVADHYISRHVAVYSVQAVTDFYREQLQLAEDELNRLRGKLVDYKKREDVSAIGARSSELVRELTLTRSSLVEAREAYAKLLTRFESGHVDVRLAGRRVAALRAREQAIQSDIEALELQESEVEALEKQIRYQESTFLESKRDYEQARLNGASNAETINVRLLEHAATPVTPRFPRLMLIILSIPFGFMLSVSIALLREYMDHRVNDPDSAEAALGLPCLGSVPEFGFLSRRKLG